ncbi:MAG: hypothetical protein FJ086_11780 [Deltaproteobacteria bacterium]|nr:hypothetical protein [Deltaproteobacteria bacterium]
MKKTAALMLSLPLSLLAAPALAEPLELTLEEFKMYRGYHSALEDPKVQAMKPDARLAAIAKKNFKVSAGELEAAVQKGEAAGDIGGRCAAQLKAALAGTSLGPVVTMVDVDAKAEHAVAYVAWANEDTAQLEEEAATVASQARACPVISSVQVWATARGAPTQRVFQALVSASAASKVQPDKIKDFADTRYIKLFEKVKNAANGDDLSQPAP